MTDKQQKAFDKQKNAKAAAITGGITLALLALSFLSWKLPELEQPIKEEYVEVDVDFLNLGNSAVGTGDIQPLVPGDFAPETQETAAEPPKASQEANPEEAADPITDDDGDGPEVTKPVTKPTTPTTRIPDRVVNNNTNNKPANNNTPVTNPTPAPRRPATVFTRPGATGPGGNNADTYNNSRNQGPGNGNGDYGDPDGTPDGNGTRKKLTNANITNMGQILRESGTSFKGKVYLKLRVDANGSVSGIISNTPAPFDREAKDFAAGLARKIKFNAGADGRTADVTLSFNMN